MMGSAIPNRWSSIRRPVSGTYYVSAGGFSTNTGTYTLSSVADRARPNESGFGVFYALGSADTTNMGSGAFFQGYVSDFRVWNVARSDSDIISWRNQPLIGNEAGVVLNWKLDGSTGVLAFDSSINMQNGTPVGNVVAPLPHVRGPIRLSVTDTLGDPVDVVPVFDATQINVSIDGNYLFVTPVAGFAGTSRISLIAKDGTGAPADYRGRTATMSFDITFAANALYGTKFNDLNGNGVLDAGETGLDGVELFLDMNANHMPDAGELVTWTDANGDYSFGGLPHIDAVPYGPAILTGSEAVTATGGAGETTLTQTTPTEIVTRSEAKLRFHPAGAAGRIVIRWQRQGGDGGERKPLHDGFFDSRSPLQDG